MNTVTAPLTSAAAVPRLTLVRPAGPETAPSALTRTHPDLAGAFAEFYVLAGWPPAKLALWDGDPAFTAEVQAAMRRIPPAARHLRLVPGGER